VSHTPDLVQIHDRYADLDVLFLGLTEEGLESLGAIENFAQRLNVPWPIGYGAGSAITALEVPGYPTTFVIGRDGTVSWNSFMPGTLVDAIEKAM
jgi:hypothetical protein